MLLEYAMKDIAKLSVVAHAELKKRLDATLLLTTYAETLLKLAQDPTNVDFQGNNTLYKNPYPRTIRIAPSVHEMYTAISRLDLEIEKLNRSDASLEEKARIKKEMCRDAIKPKQVITIKERPLIGWGDCLKTINFRPGYINNDRTKCLPFMLGGTKSHIGALGDTGEGKSVMMNAIIIGQLLEYPSWELNLTMNDGKMQEYGLYAGAYRCPQIRSIAITQSSAYLASVMKFFASEMNEMNLLYTKLGIKGLDSIRDYLDLYIPANLMIHDEFAQAKALASPQEAASIDESLQGIAKLGRATRYHIFPTSQELQGHLDKTVIAQMSIGVAVGTNEDNSKFMLGNGAAEKLKSMQGYCIVNTNRIEGKVKDNRLYKVAFLPDKTQEQRDQFQHILKQVCDTYRELGIKDEPVVYNEKDQWLMSQYDGFMSNVDKSDKSTKRLYGETTLVNVGLGLGTRYTGTQDVFEYFRWDYERKGNIFVHAQDTNVMKYIGELIGKSFDYYNVEAVHKMIIDNTEIFSPNFAKKCKRDLTGEFNTEAMAGEVAMRAVLLKYMQASKENKVTPSVKGFLQLIYKKGYTSVFSDLENIIGDLAKMTDDTFNQFLDKINNDNLESLNKSLFDYKQKNIKIWDDIIYSMTFYFDNMLKAKGTYLKATDFKPIVFWFLDPKNNIGIFNRAGIKDAFINFLEVGPSVGVFSIVFMTDVRDMKGIYVACKHEIIGRPVTQFESNAWVTFKDDSGIVCKYMICDGDGSKDRYFKKFIVFD